MATFFPQSDVSLMDIHGVGAVKQERYGSVFLSIIQEYCRDHQIEASLKPTRTSSAATKRVVGKQPQMFKAQDHWEPEDISTREFIHKKIRKIGSIEEVNKHYSSDSPIDQYARTIAHLILEKKSDSSGESVDLDENLMRAKRIINSIPIQKPDDSFSDDHLQRIRKKYSRAYEPWTTQEDELLAELSATRRDTETLAGLFQRQPSAISNRIKKLTFYQRGKTEGKGQRSKPGEDLRVIGPKADIATLGDEQDGIELQLICLANSRKHSGRCIAGKQFFLKQVGEWIRPVSRRETGELSVSEIRFPDGSLPELLDVVTVRLEEHILHTYQVENYLINEGQEWVKTGRLAADELRDLCDDVDTLWINGYHSSNGINDRIPLNMADDRLGSSLLLIRPDNLSISVAQESRKKMKVRGKFSYKGTKYALVITDSMVEKKYLQKTSCEYPVKENNVFLCLSIGEPHEGYCYKLLAGVINLL